MLPKVWLDVPLPAPFTCKVPPPNVILLDEFNVPVVFVDKSSISVPALTTTPPVNVLTPVKVNMPIPVLVRLYP